MEVFLYITIIAFLVLIVGSFYQFRYNLKMYKDGDIGPYRVWFWIWLVFFGTAWLIIGIVKLVPIVIFLIKFYG